MFNIYVINKKGGSCQKTKAININKLKVFSLFIFGNIVFNK